MRRLFPIVIAATVVFKNVISEGYTDNPVGECSGTGCAATSGPYTVYTDNPVWECSGTGCAATTTVGTTPQPRTKNEPQCNGEFRRIDVSKACRGNLYRCPCGSCIPKYQCKNKMYQWGRMPYWDRQRKTPQEPKRRNNRKVRELQCFNGEVRWVDKDEACPNLRGYKLYRCPCGACIKKSLCAARMRQWGHYVYWDRKN